VHKGTIEMINLKKGFLFIALAFYTLTLTSQITVNYVEPKKVRYSLGDLINLQVTLKCAPETCLSGMKQSKIFVSGLKIEKQSEWKEIAKATFQKQVQLRVVKGKKNRSKLTILRKVDKESQFHQELFPVE